MAISPDPYPPLAGKRFKVSVLSVTLSDGRKVAPTSIACKARIGTAPLRGTGRGGCTFRIPLSARRKTISVSITAAYRGSQKTLSISSRIR